MRWAHPKQCDDLEELGRAPATERWDYLGALFIVLTPPERGGGGVMLTLKRKCVCESVCVCVEKEKGTKVRWRETKTLTSEELQQRAIKRHLAHNNEGCVCLCVCCTVCTCNVRVCIDSNWANMEPQALVNFHSLYHTNMCVWCTCMWTCVHSMCAGWFVPWTHTHTHICTCVCHFSHEHVVYIVGGIAAANELCLFHKMV